MWFILKINEEYLEVLEPQLLDWSVLESIPNPVKYTLGFRVRAGSESLFCIFLVLCSVASD